MVSSNATFEGCHEVIPANRAAFLVSQSFPTALSDATQLTSFLLASEHQVGVKQLADSSVTPAPGEHEDDGRQEVGLVEGTHHLDTARLVARATRPTATPPTLCRGPTESASSIRHTVFPLARPSSRTTGVITLEPGLLLGNGG